MYIEKFRLDGRKAVITGGGRGIGFAATQALAEAGASLTITDVDSALLDEAKRALSELGYSVSTAVMDVTDSQSVSTVTEQITTQMGGVDILVANAGIAWPDTPSEDMADDVWHRVLDVNLNGSFWTCREFGRRMLQAKGGNIVTLGSISGLISNKPQRQTQYNAAKAGVHHMTKSLAAEWAERGVRVNSIAPTYVDTEMSRGGFDDETLFPIWMDNTPMRRVALPDEVASTILFLVSDASSAITGAVLPVDCGYTLW
ncbi:SDR family NAD(P)-dependent oxidoreductase [Lentilitoribacter sp. EG35]|uniref:SDR family NAD(P)-dependent oxidoreductase n=1 Tax=Lentilitoribacter sp. EG35 TaxID=3234192 RepID=UPI00345FA0A3